MDCDVTIRKLETLLRKATHESLNEPDPSAVNIFCELIHENAAAHYLAIKVIALRIHSVKPKEALLGLKLLDVCMKRCGPNFVAEVGKFRFLNEMIKLVSPKFLAQRTSSEVKDMVLYLIHHWSEEYPNECKFKIAFDMLKNQGVLKNEPSACTESSFDVKKSDGLFKDDRKYEMLKKLLQSKNAEDIQLANQLIKTMVLEEERRTEEKSKNVILVLHANEASKLLKELLENSMNSTADEKLIIEEVHETCRKHHALLLEAAAVTDSDVLNDILNAADELSKVFLLYDEYKEPHTSHCESKNLLDLSETNSGCENVLIDDQSRSDSTHENDALTSFDVLNSAPLMESYSVINPESASVSTSKAISNSVWDDLEKLMKEEVSNSKTTLIAAEKLKNITSPKHTSTTKEQTQSNGIFDLTYLMENREKAFDLQYLMGNQETPRGSNSEDSNNDDMLLNLENDCATNVTGSIHTEAYDKLFSDNAMYNAFDELEFKLEDVKHSRLNPMKIFDESDGLTVMLHFAKDRPVGVGFVLVVSTTSRCKRKLEGFKFQGIFPKTCRVRHLEQSDTFIPAYNPFLPPPALTQIILLLPSSEHQAIDMKFVISYVCENETFTEVGIVDKLPLDEIEKE